MKAGFVLALIALSSVFSVKHNKVLKEEKVLSVSLPNENVELKTENLTDESQIKRKKLEVSLETDNEKPRKVASGEDKIEKAKKSLSTQASCGELNDVLKALEGTEGYDDVRKVMEKNNCKIL